MTESETALARIARLAADLGDVVVVEDAAMIEVGGTRASVRVLDLGDGLEVVAVTQLVASGLANTDELRDAVETRSAGLSFGSLRRSGNGADTVDVLLSYTFPLGELADLPLLTVLHMVLSAGVDTRAEVLGSSGE
ncbi:hypothetical protein GOEFS_061_00300 [Gordonia effusa NBRC 100432]|uniref:Uncharacterized protein n=1 Tax=Gordonia effusa NBRC 100432 TaxID=1077974 RepID=H0R0U0_9ACTN|nr:hypothetical protein [Gordonia effusa]GAB18691.1 hypothetical protein GOEFS_061_00300 [Gordonia effusa NBRC 100432]